METLESVLQKNRKWASAMTAEDPDFFQRLSKDQAPGYLWIGCSDSRVPASKIMDLPPGEVFVHRNIANLVIHSDMNCLSVVEYAVHALKVKDIIVCGHYGCGGVKAAIENQADGMVDHWLGHIKDTNRLHCEELDALPFQERWDRLCELNVIAQVGNLCGTRTIKSAWESGAELRVHGLIYDLKDGVLKDLKTSFRCSQEFAW